jgi:hypothetical protein
VRRCPCLQDAEARLVRASMKFELLFNSKTVKQIGLTIPSKVLARVIK